MKTLVAATSLFLASCAAPLPEPLPAPAPAQSCPDLPELPANPTPAQLEAFSLAVVHLYGACRKAAAAARANQ